MMPNVRVEGESEAYRKHRVKLLEAEIALKDQRERVADLRRQLPLGAEVKPDYVFREGPADSRDDNQKKYFDTRLSGLFSKGEDRLIVYHMMYEPDSDMACRMCSMWVDGYNAIVPHLAQIVNFAVIAKADIEKLRAWGPRRGWGEAETVIESRQLLQSRFQRRSRGRSVACSERVLPREERQDPSFLHNRSIARIPPSSGT